MWLSTPYSFPRLSHAFRASNSDARARFCNFTSRKINGVTPAAPFSIVLFLVPLPQPAHVDYLAGRTSRRSLALVSLGVSADTVGRITRQSNRD
jgi:hypothetical protein